MSVIDLTEIQSGKQRLLTESVAAKAFFGIRTILTDSGVNVIEWPRGLVTKSRNHRFLERVHICT